MSNQNDCSNGGCPIYGPFFGVMGAASAIVFSGKYKIKLFNGKI